MLTTELKKKKLHSQQFFLPTTHYITLCMNVHIYNIIDLKSKNKQKTPFHGSKNDLVCGFV